MFFSSLYRSSVPSFTLGATRAKNRLFKNGQRGRAVDGGGGHVGGRRRAH